MTEPFTVVAIIAAYNEEDIIEACLDHLHRQGIDSYLLDDGSTDETVERARPFVGKGLIAIEPLAQTTPATFSLDRILARKEALAQSLQASWFINHDADEFRDSLWSELDLRQAIERVDRMGWNAIDFEIFTIHPVGDPVTALADPSQPPPWYSPGAYYDRLQVRAWKRTLGPIDLRTTAGHDVMFEARSVFPLRFPMRHYPVRSQTQGARKVFQERLPRFDKNERGRGWHVQYDRLGSGDLVAAPSELMPYDPVEARIRSALHNRDLEMAHTELQARLERRAHQRHIEALNEFQLRERELIVVIERVRLEKTKLQKELSEAIERARSVKAELERELAGAVERAWIEKAELSIQLADSTERARVHKVRLEHEVRVRDAAVVRLAEDVRWIQEERDAIKHQLALVYASRSWRWMKPLRIAFRLLGGR